MSPTIDKFHLRSPNVAHRMTADKFNQSHRYAKLSTTRPQKVEARPNIKGSRRSDFISTSYALAQNTDKETRFPLSGNVIDAMELRRMLFAVDVEWIECGHTHISEMRQLKKWYWGSARRCATFRLKAERNFARSALGVHRKVEEIGTGH